MTGPPYPRYGLGAAPGQNAIGTFVIGASPIGDIPTFDLWTTIISQYANSPILDAMIQSFNDAMDQTENLDNFYDMMWNVFTAQGYGLDVWGRIVGVVRTLSLPGTGLYLGYEEATGWTGFGPAAGQGELFGGSTLTTNYDLSDPDFRRLILAKAASNISDGSIPSVNAILLALFPDRGVTYVQDNLNMTVTYVFKFPLSVVDVAILDQANVLPTSAGVSATVEQLP
jgi:Protein of unknown function (DUF2612)